MPENSSATAPPCPLWRRLLALVYDLLIVVAIMMVAVMIGLLLQQAVIRVLVAAAPLLLLMLQPRIGLHATLWALLLVWAGWFALALFDPRRRALHDLAANTEIRLLS
jgi:hypothetical protein